MTLTNKQAKSLQPFFNTAILSSLSISNSQCRQLPDINQHQHDFSAICGGLNLVILIPKMLKVVAILGQTYFSCPECLFAFYLKKRPKKHTFE